MHDIQEGKISRNKNYYTLAKAKEFSRFKRAKLLISLIEDLKRTSAINGNKIEVEKNEGLIEIKLFNPILKYNRKVIVTEAELNLLMSQTEAISFESV
ncbi:MAG: hypothetical protein GY866_21485 [Proteobacteria bacterium]|nr:hypothetical protein [Pseudomonadota bacterium]